MAENTPDEPTSEGSASEPADESSTAAAADESSTAAAAEASGSPLHELGGYIRHQRESARLSLRKLAKQAGVSNPYLSQIERGLRKPSAEILQAIAKALEISSETLYVKAGILEERDSDETLEDVVRRDPHLTDAQRQALVEMYRSFCRLSELQDRPGRPNRLRGLLDVARAGDVDDAAIQAASPLEEDEGLGG